MRKLMTTTFVTLDGVMQAPGGPEEDTSGGFSWGGWSANYWDDMMGQVIGDVLSRPHEMLLGRKTYDIFAGYWPRHVDQPGADALNSAKKYVVSKTLDRVDWNNSVLIRGDAVREITRLKQMDAPELQVHGSGNLIQTLLIHDLVDEMLVWIFPVSVGKGKRLFGRGAGPAGFKLVESKTSTTGVIIAAYQRRGELKPGTVGE